MSYTFVDQQNKLSSLLGDGNTTTDDMFPLDIRKKELNQAEIQFAVDSKDLLAYATGTISGSTITVPSDWIETYHLIIDSRNIANNREISLADYERFYNWGGSPPYFYYWPDASGNKLMNLIGSVNGSTYKLYYFCKPSTELSADTDVSVHPEQFRKAPCYYTASEFMRQIGKNEQADEYRMIYESIVQSADSWARKLYVDKIYARPDFGESDTSIIDTQGG